MRRWLLAIGIGLTACGTARAGSASADLAVGVTVIDQCLIHTDSRSVSCAAGSAYAMGESRERIAVTSDRLTTADEHAHTALDGSRLGASQSLAGASAPDGAVRAIAATAAPVEAIRVTYSF